MQSILNYFLALIGNAIAGYKCEVVIASATGIILIVTVSIIACQVGRKIYRCRESTKNTPIQAIPIESEPQISEELVYIDGYYMSGNMDEYENYTPNNDRPYTNTSQSNHKSSSRRTENKCHEIYNNEDEYANL